jgi:hypothetical protein
MQGTEPHRLNRTEKAIPIAGPGDSGGKWWRIRAPRHQALEVTMAMQHDVRPPLHPHHDRFGRKADEKASFRQAPAPRLHLNGDVCRILSGTARHGADDGHLIPHCRIVSEADVLLQDVRSGAWQMARREVQHERVHDQRMGSVRQLRPVRSRAKQRRRDLEAALRQHLSHTRHQPHCRIRAGAADKDAGISGSNRHVV